jgi:hypothetical protein
LMPTTLLRPLPDRACFSRFLPLLLSSSCMPRPCRSATALNSLGAQPAVAEIGQQIHDMTRHTNSPGQPRCQGARTATLCWCHIGMHSRRGY